jgi:hypothetical protein
LIPILGITRLGIAGQVVGNVIFGLGLIGFRYSLIQIAQKIVENQSCPTQRALDGWDSAPFSGVFHAELEVFSTPACPQATQTVRKS